MRYKHIPYLYTLFYEHSIRGDPIISPLFYHYPGIQERDHQMLVGKILRQISIIFHNLSLLRIFSDIDIKIQLFFLIGRDIMAVAVVNASVQTCEVVFPGTRNEIWYQVDKGTWNPHHGGTVQRVPVDIKTVSSTVQGNFLFLCI